LAWLPCCRISAAAHHPGGTALLDSALAVGLSRGAGPDRFNRCAQPDQRCAAQRALAFYGRISYGLYMIHISVFIYFGG